MKSSAVLAALFLAAIAEPTLAQKPKKFDDLLRRVPQEANAMLLVDVDALFDSPLGRREQWREKSVDRPTGVLGVSADAARFAVAAGVDLTTGEERWKIGMLATHANPPSLQTLAAREGGFVEQVETQNVAWTPRNFYLLSFPERIIGFAVPTDRQALSSWMSNLFIKPRTFPPGWGDRAVNRANAGTPIVLAIDLQKAIAPKQAEIWLTAFPSETVKKFAINHDLLGSKIAAAKSATLSIEVKETIEASIRIEFEYSIDMLKPIAKELVLSVLADYGASNEEVERWSCEAGGTSITLAGRLSEDSVRRFLGLLPAPTLTLSQESPGSPPPIATAPAAVTPGQPAPDPSPDVVLKATQKYYRSVVDITRSLKSQKATSQQSLKLWYDRSARQIEELPILYVDNEVLDWGSLVARTVREMAMSINFTNKDTTHRIVGTANGAYGGYNGGSRAVSAGVITKQNNAVLDVSLDGKWQTLETSISDMRRKLVGKYKVDF